MVIDYMQFSQALLLGALQGITEWLPISSSGQGMLAGINFIGLSAENAFSIIVLLHAGTLAAVLIKFRKKIGEVLTGGDLIKNRLLVFIVVSTVFTAVIGLPTYVFVKKELSNLTGEGVNGAVGLLLVATGVILYISRGKYGIKEVDNASYRDMIIVGAVQGLTILPGISRSGFTVSALLLRGFKAEDSLVLSFLMSIPAVLGVLVIELMGGAITPAGWVYAGLASSLVFGYLTIDVLLRMANKVRFDIFCILFGAIAVIVSISAI